MTGLQLQSTAAASNRHSWIVQKVLLTAASLVLFPPPLGPRQGYFVVFLSEGLSVMDWSPQWASPGGEPVGLRRRPQADMAIAGAWALVRGG